VIPRRRFCLGEFFSLPARRVCNAGGRILIRNREADVQNVVEFSLVQRHRQARPSTAVARHRRGWGALGLLQPKTCRDALPCGMSDTPRKVGKLLDAHLHFTGVPDRTIMTTGVRAL
jgi:hypothetical protein